MSNLTAIPQEPKAEQHHFDAELHELPAITLGRVADDLRFLIDRRWREFHKAHANGAGVRESIDFLKYLLNCIEGEVRRRDNGGGR